MLRNGCVVAVLAAAPAFADPQTVVAFGDSLTQGYGLPDGEGFVPVLQRWLDEHGAEATVVNAGVSGDTTAGGLARIDWALADGADAMILNLGGNDMLRGLDPAMTRENLDAILGKADAAGVRTLLVGLKAPGNYGIDYKEQFDGIAVALAREHGTPLVPDYLAPLTENGRLVQAYVQQDGIHPNAAGVKILVDAIGPRVLDLLTDRSAP